MSVRLHAATQNSWTNFHEIWQRLIIRKSVDTFQIVLNRTTITTTLHKHLAFKSVVAENTLDYLGYYSKFDYCDYNPNSQPTAQPFGGILHTDSNPQPDTLPTQKSVDPRQPWSR